MDYESMLIGKLSRGEIININEWSNYDLNNLAKQVAELVPNCLGVCYAFGNSISLVIGK